MFTHLHVHSHYSLLDGLPKIDELIQKAKEYKMKALALTDHGALYGAIEFYQKAKAANLKPIIGEEIYIISQDQSLKQPKANEKRHHLTLLAKNEIGYKNLIKLTTIAHLEGFYYKPRINWELLEKYSEGLIVLSGCIKGEIPQLILEGKIEEAKNLILKYKDFFGSENFYLEVQHHLDPDYKKTNLALFDLAEKYGLSAIATNDIHYLEKEDDEAQDILLCLQTKRKKEDKNRLCMLGEDFSFRSPEKMKENFKDRPEAIENTQKIVEACNLEIELGKIKLPHFEVPGGNVNNYLKELCDEGLKRKFSISLSDLPALKEAPESENKKRKLAILERLEYELSIIKQTGFASCFLIVQDFVNWALINGIGAGPGRGSAPGSLVSYLLNITNINPLEYTLLFERFLNLERVSLPDIDLDFADDRREEVVKYIERKYGRSHVAQIATFGTMAARAAIRDVGRVLGFSYSFVDKIAKMIPYNRSINEALEIVPELKQTYETEVDIKNLIEIAKKLEGVARHISTHACGIVITKEPLEYYLPLQHPTQDDKTIVTQFSMESIEALGLLKIDILGLRNLTVLKNTLQLIEQNHGIKIDLNKISLNDKKTFKLFREGKTTGLFQFESPGMKKYLTQLKPTEIEDLVAMNALHRPGAIEWIDDYIAGKRGKKKITYLHPRLEAILEKTYGIAIYQEQVMEIAKNLAGFSPLEADILRKAVAKKKRDLLKIQKEKFIQGCINNNIPKNIAEEIFVFIIEPFGGYGFNRSHAVSYALIGYWTAYLKAHWPTEFMAALLNSDRDDIDRIAIEIEETRQMGIEILSPDINESFENFTISQKRQKVDDQQLGHQKFVIRFGLSAIKNIGYNVVKTIIEERKKEGKFKNIEDFIIRVKSKDLNKKSLESFIKCGALDQFGDRKTLLANIDYLLEFKKNQERDSLKRQATLFNFLTKEKSLNLKLKKEEKIDMRTKLAWEKELLGLYISKHPIKEIGSFLKDIAKPITEILQMPARNRFDNLQIVGIITKIQKVFTRNNEPMLFVRLEDLSASIEVLVFPALLKSTSHLWQEDKIVLIKGRVSDKDAVSKFLANEAEEVDLEKIKKAQKTVNKKIDNSYKSYKGIASRLLVACDDRIDTINSSSVVLTTLPLSVTQEKLEELKTVFTNHPGENKVYLLFNEGGRIRKINSNFSVQINETLIQEIERIVGKGLVEIK